MIKKIDLNEFHEKYCYNPHREELYEYLIEELEVIKSQSTCCRILVFGSYIRRKKEPNDIDILISLIPHQDSVYRLMKEGLKKMHPDKIDIQYNKTQYSLRDAEGLRDYFNENPLNKKKGIRINRAIELVNF